MPTSPRRPDQSDSRSTAGRGKAKRKPKPTSKATNRKKKIKKRYSSAREEAQLAGVIPTTPDGAVKDERVPASAQGTQPLSEMVATAIRLGWATKDEVKPELVEEMVKIVLDPEMKTKDKVAAFNALRMADQSQWERDHPEVAGKARGGGGGNGSVNVQVNVEAAAIVRRMIERGDLGIIEVPPEPDGAGGGRLAGSVEAAPALGGDKQHAGDGVADTQ